MLSNTYNLRKEEKPMINLIQRDKTAKPKAVSKKCKTKVNIEFTSSRLSYHLIQSSVIIKSGITKPIYKETIGIYKHKSTPLGLEPGKIPIKYIEDNHKQEIISDMKIFLFKFFVLDFLFNAIQQKKIPVTNYPRLTQISVDENFNFKYNFDLSSSDQIELKEWKNFAFKGTKRKKYKDLDKQVENFIKKESLSTKKQNSMTIGEGDWIIFETTLLKHKTNEPLLPNHKINFCIKITKQFEIHPFQKLFIGKKATDSFITDHFPIEENSILDGSSKYYSFLIQIQSVTRGSYFSSDLFKATFKLKSKCDTHNKLIEAFSFKDDISQRRSTVEELFHLMLSKHRFEVPMHIVIRRKEDILLILKKQPDFQVYRNQPDFDRQVSILAEQQLKEEILMDQIKYSENINIENKDIQNYLHLLNNNRLREFIHFKPPHSQIEKTNFPVNISSLKQVAGKEKILNYVLYSLTR